MGQVITLEDYVPPARYDGDPWTQARIEEGDTVDGTFVELETQTITPVDVDPENPAARSFTTTLASETAGLWYRIVFLDAFGNDTQPTSPIQNGGTEPYATVEELAGILKVNPTNRRAALQRVLDVAAYEIDAEIGQTSADLDASQLQVAAEVNLERAVEHWQQQQTPFGIVGIDGEAGPAFVSRDTWNRHAHKLAPLKVSWGIA